MGKRHIKGTLYAITGARGGGQRNAIKLSNGRMRFISKEAARRRGIHVRPSYRRKRIRKTTRKRRYRRMY